MWLKSDAFTEGGVFPDRLTLRGGNVAPRLRWDEYPAETKSFVLIMEDPDAPGSTPWVHWVLYDIPSYPVNWETEYVGQVGKNSWDETRYMGPDPPSGDGTHNYVFKLFALSRDNLPFTGNATKEEVMEVAEPYIVDAASLTGNYTTL
jgi:hypothetical protein|tara:strand:+ start:275 stop:718 length:444 start_codon:yes stop_codon:yes gene_type:complete